MDIKAIGKNIGRGVSKFFLGNSVSISSFLGGMGIGSWNRHNLIKQYSRQVFSIVRARSEEAAKIDFQAYRLDSKGDKVVISKHPFLDLMKKPNPNQSQFQFMEFYFTDMDIFGEAFWYVARGERSKMPRELYRLNPANMDIALNKDENGNQIIGYVLHKSDGKDVPFEPDEIIHVKTPNLDNPTRGKSIIQAGQDYIQTEEYATDWTKNAIYNAGRPSGILNVKGNISSDEFNALKRKFKDSYSGTKNAGKTMLLKSADGLDYQKLGMELQEVALKEMKDMTRDDIMFMFRMSKTLMGISDDVNRSNAREAKAVFIENIVVPMLDRLVDHINAFFIDDFNSRASKYFKNYVKYQDKAGNETISDIIIGYHDPRVIDEAEKLNQWKEGYNKWLTTNDIRQEKGLEPIEGGDVIYIPFNLVPMGKTVSTESEKGIVKTDELPEPIKTDKMTTSEVVQTETKKVAKTITKKRKEKVSSAKIAVEPVKKQESIITDEIAEAFRKTLFKGEIVWEQKIEEIIAGEFARQQKEILRKNRKGVVNKELQDWFFDKIKSDGQFLTLLRPAILDMMSELSKQAFALADNPEGILDLDMELMQIVNERIQRFAQKTNDETILSITDTITEGLARNETVNELKDRIRAIYKEASEVRAKRIARTESVFAVSESSVQAYRQSGVPRKRWFAEPDACEFCKEYHGKIIGIGEDFVAQGQTITIGDHTMTLDYSDINHPPMHPNCECAILPVINER